MTQVVARRHAFGHTVAVVSLCVAVSAACGGRSDDTEGNSDDPSPPGRTLSALPAPSDPPPSGRLVAEMRQSSLDASLGRMQVWIANDTRHGARPESLTYDDVRLRAPLQSYPARLRPIPAGSERGFPLVLPRRVDCDAPSSSDDRTEGIGHVEVRTPRFTRRLRVSDETDVVGRFISMRCAMQRLAKVARLSWSDAVPADRSGPGSTGTLTLQIEPIGASAGVLRLDTVVGSHLLGSASKPPVWEPDVVVRADDPPSRIRLPVVPARCDPHGFVEGGGATAFRVRFVVDGRPGEVVLRMSDAGRRAALAFARASCGLD